jgi:putative endonuclease
LVVGSNPSAATNSPIVPIDMRFTVYVLRSLRNGRHYVGFTSRPLELRLDEHNRGYPRGWSSRNGSFEVIYQEGHGLEEEARARERFLKSGQGREWLRARLAAYPPEAGGDP